MGNDKMNRGFDGEEQDISSFDLQDFEDLRHELSPWMKEYREQVIETIEPSAAYRASMHKMMMGLVRDDVLKAHKKASLSTKIAARCQRWVACWHELVASSLLFRLGSQGVLALGLGLILSMAWISAMDEKPVAAKSTLEEQKSMVPEATWKSRIPNPDEFRPGERDHLPAIPSGRSVKKVKKK